jgi:hypothetical protein
MISVILYGRNDSHGYNLHKRAAISFNCIAEVLTDPDDEILFVDYNTPNDLPTFVEAIYDTLTPRAKSLLRVFRVRPELHARLVTGTHLSALEPHSRNIAIRRSNSQNRWLLFTNTDMIFVPRGAGSGLNEAVADLADAHYALPRFELPEPLWESFPRTDPRRVMDACDELGRKLHLNEIALSHPYMRFDSPGDFQLCSRRVMFEIEGFDERMIHGWHVDSNLCKRLYTYYDRRTESLAHRLKGYHCDHTRVATLAHRLDIKLENDLQEFVYGVEDPIARHQAGKWGAPDEQIEEVDFVRGPQARFAAAVEKAIGAPQQIDYQSDANDVRNYVYYRPEHALSYLASHLALFPRTARFAYAGNNPRMLGLITRCVREMGFLLPVAFSGDLLSAGPGPESARRVEAIDIGERGVIESWLSDHDLIIYDFGLDASELNLSQITRVTQWPRDLRYSLGAVARFLEQCAESADSFWRAGRAIPDFIVLNANHYVFHRFVGQFLIATDTPYNTHVRKGRPRVGSERLYRSNLWKFTEDQMRSFFGYGIETGMVGPAYPGLIIDLTASAESSQYKDGDWGWIDYSGTWTDGSLAEIVFSPPSPVQDLTAHVEVSEAFLPLDDSPIAIHVMFEDRPLARWLVSSRYGGTQFRITLPGHLMMEKQVCRLAFHIENPQSAHAHAMHHGQQVIGEDPRELGVKIQRITMSADHVRYSPGDELTFTDQGKGPVHLADFWGQPDRLGTWTIGPEAALSLHFTEPPEQAAVATVVMNDAVVNDDCPELKVKFLVNGRELAEWKLGPARSLEQRTVLIPADLIALSNPVQVLFRIDSPRTPVQLGWAEHDTRLLGFRLFSFRIDPLESYRIGEVMDFTKAGSGGRFLDYGWSHPDEYGCWTLGPEATIRVPLPQPVAEDLPASFIFSDCMVSAESPELTVRVACGDRVITSWIFGPGRETHARSILIPVDLVSGHRELVLRFEVVDPRSPESLGWSLDSRPLGIRITRASFGEKELPVSPPSRALVMTLGGKVRDLITRAYSRTKSQDGVAPPAEDDRLKCSPGQVLEFTKTGAGRFRLGEGWDDSDELGTWTLGPQTELAVHLTRPFEDAAILRLTLNDFAVSHDHPVLKVSVSVNETAVSQWTFGPSRTTVERQMVLPAHLLAENNLVRISFQIDSPHTPVELGWSRHDLRPLGFRLSTLSITEVLKYRLGDVMDFKVGGAAIELLDEGWSHPDPAGCWTVGDRALLNVALTDPAENADLFLSLLFSGSMVGKGGPGLPVRLSWDGRILAEWVFDVAGESRRSVVIPGDLVAGRREMTFIIEVADPRSPESLGWSSDPRPLGIRLAEASLGTSVPAHGTDHRSAPFVARLRSLATHAARSVKGADS